MSTPQASLPVTPASPSHEPETSAGPVSVPADVIIAAATIATETNVCTAAAPTSTSALEFRQPNYLTTTSVPPATPAIQSPVTSTSTRSPRRRLSFSHRFLS